MTGYKAFSYNTIPDLWQHQAKAVYQVMGLWAIWCHWLEVWNVVIEVGYVNAAEVAELWLSECMLRLKQELIFRLARVSRCDAILGRSQQLCGQQLCEWFSVFGMVHGCMQWVTVGGHT